jgi:hypothetical protein
MPQARDPRADRAVPGSTRRERALAWLATGPLARLAAFVLDLGAALAGAALARLRRSSSPHH